MSSSQDDASKLTVTDHHIELLFIFANFCIVYLPHCLCDPYRVTSEKEDSSLPDRIHVA